MQILELPRDTAPPAKPVELIATLVPFGEPATSAVAMTPPAIERVRATHHRHDLPSGINFA